MGSRAQGVQSFEADVGDLLVPLSSGFQTDQLGHENTGSWRHKSSDAHFSGLVCEG